MCQKTLINTTWIFSSVQRMKPTQKHWNLHKISPSYHFSRRSKFSTLSVSFFLLLKSSRKRKPPPTTQHNNPTPHGWRRDAQAHPHSLTQASQHAASKIPLQLATCLTWLTCDNLTRDDALSRTRRRRRRRKRPHTTTAAARTRRRRPDSCKLFNETENEIATPSGGPTTDVGDGVVFGSVSVRRRALGGLSCWRLQAWQAPWNSLSGLRGCVGAQI